MTNEEIMILGKLSGQMGAVIDTQKGQTETIGKIFDRLDKLPCNDHSATIKSLCDWKDSCGDLEIGKMLETHKGTISLKNAIIGGVILVISTALIETIVNLIFTGKP
jgi:hypothetical protein